MESPSRTHQRHAFYSCFLLEGKPIPWYTLHRDNQFDGLLISYTRPEIEEDKITFGSDEDNNKSDEN